MQEKINKNKNPIKIHLEKGKDYYWCACGLSKDGIFCDGSHKATRLVPMKFSVQEDKSYFLCGCKKTNKKPFCDGSHSKS
ncbi:MAG: CDGSH iron-sulfur domain-containing protein [Candidatus Fonsibacter lacus]|jgi:CDGSH iron-sulfur domain-containing protein 3|uniref:CDGSH iron-sulfur domain-containing protein n=1 Tax=Candidatus Fonsibacter lacus TaxID=2576439 RepID=A0A964XQ76_9PROT|nr:CDGSH iron-sulfur domain-containing protein [Candidatus Fonsibacter lacus]NBP59999.1 CDGSH iron-sulfur domain-containing protein [Pseudomonadota bacterium]NBW38933.1 CDGSH iron-sulfur domain-containing protein [Cytophagia bacterium]NKA17565.1 CDGSH iron-sulfur domain-containing protein [Candidatus Fonsibacter sp. PEL55]NCU71842.1 CDGSH iron-sulfur domain-containing protein [Candidatus Fonsibacter lacus]